MVVFVHERCEGDNLWHVMFHLLLNRAAVKVMHFTLRHTKSWLVRAASQAFTPTGGMMASANSLRPDAVDGDDAEHPLGVREENPIEGGIAS